MADQVESLIPALIPRPPLWRRVFAWTLIAVFYGGSFGLAYAGVVRIVRAFGPHVAWGDRVWIGLAAAVLLSPVGWLVWFFVKQRLKTGRWSKTKEERLQDLTQCRVRSADARSAQFSLVSYAFRWADFSARDAAAPLWKRVAGWMLLVFYAALLVGIGAMGLIAIGAAFADDNTLTQSIIFLGFAAILLMIPTVVVMLGVRRRRERGSFWTSRADLDELESLSRNGNGARARSQCERRLCPRR